MAKEIAFALDLNDDPETLAAYRDWHARVWPEIMRGMAAHGVLSQNIYMIGNRLFMVLEVEDGFDYRVDFQRYLEQTPRAGEWDVLMRAFQKPVPWAGEGEWWAPMERVYDLNAGLARIGGDPRPAQSPGGVLDTHHHLWKISRGDYGWMSPDLDVLYRDYMPGDLAPALRQAGVTRTILVQAADTEAETEFLLDIAASCDWIVGVCGWLDMDSDSFPQRLDHFRKNPLFRSFRPMLQDLPEDDWILKPRVLDNLAYVAETGTAFEILTKPPQLPHAIEAVERTPGLRAVVNHISKPYIARREMEPWASQIARLRDYPDVYCKLSGMVTEAGADWTPEDLRPYVSHVLDVFGQDRVMFGSDWPVALLAASGYGDVVNALRTIVGPFLSLDGHRKVFHDNGARFYGV